MFRNAHFQQLTAEPKSVPAQLARFLVNRSFKLGPVESKESSTIVGAGSTKRYKSFTRL